MLPVQGLYDSYNMYRIYSKYWDRQARANSVDLDQMPQMGHLVRVCPVCHKKTFLDTSTGSQMVLFKAQILSNLVEYGKVNTIFLSGKLLLKTSPRKK